MTHQSRSKVVLPRRAQGALAIALAASACGSLTPPFVPPDTSGTPSVPFLLPSPPLDPSAMAIGDINGDGRPDVVVANRGSDTISVLLGSANPADRGEFDPRVEILTGAQPSSLALCDANLDGKLDAVVSNAGDGTISVLLGNGDGTFQPKLDLAAGVQPTSLVAADVNRDGKPDVALLAGDPVTVHVLLGGGDGTFGAASELAIGDAPIQLAAADVNGDLAPDLVVLRSPNDGGGPDAGHGAASVLLGNGDGTFQAATDRDIGPIANWIAVADVTGDDQLDLIVTRVGTLAGGVVGVLAGHGDGQFADAVDIATDPAPVAVTTADLNGDRMTDLVVSTRRGTGAILRGAVNVLCSNGDGTFRPNFDHFGGDDPVVAMAADINQDGRPDVMVLSNANATLSVITGKGDGTLTAQTDILLGVGPVSATFADLTDDGKPDVVATDALADAVSINVGNTGGFSGGVQAVTQGAPVAVVVADVNGDGAPDVLTANQRTGSVTIALRSKTLGNLVPLLARTFHVTTGATPVAVAVGDLSGDGVADLVVADRDADAVNVLLGAAGDFAAKGDFATGAQPVALAVADVSGDGKLDVIAVDRAAATVSVLLGNGDGTLRPKVDYATRAQPVALAVADVTGDGKLDVVVANYAAGNLSLLVGNGDGTFQAAADLPSGAGSNSIVITDLTGDGVLDIAVANPNARTISVLAGDGHGGFTPRAAHVLTSRPLTINTDPRGGCRLEVVLDSGSSNAKLALGGLCPL